MAMKEQLAKIKEEALAAIQETSAAGNLDAVRVKYLGKKGELTAVLKQMGKLPAEARPGIGQIATEVRAARTAASAVATMMEHIGDISSISATTGENYVEDPGLQRTLLGDGIATALAGLIGGPANTTYGENTGVLALAKGDDPMGIRLAAIYAVVLSLLPVAAQFIGSIPSAIIGGVSFVLYGMISAIGVRNMVENHVDLTNSRNLIIAALILVSGLGFSDGSTFQVAGTSITLTALAVAALVGIITNAILPGKDYEFESQQ